MSQPFRYFLRVRYAECDAQKVVFNVHYGHYVDLATLEFLRTLGFETLLVNGPIDYQVVKQTVEWKASARFDQVLEISVRPKHLGNTSFSLNVEFRIAGSEAVIATVDTIYVMVDAATLVKTPLPNEFRSALAGGAEGLFVDHADSTPRSATKQLRAEK